MYLYVSIPELKSQLNIVEEYTGEDMYLTGLLETSQMSIEFHIQQPLSTFVNEEKSLNPMLKHAILILASHFYANREPVAYVQPRIIPYTFEYLLQPFKKYT